MFSAYVVFVCLSACLFVFTLLFRLWFVMAANLANKDYISLTYLRSCKKLEPLY